MSEVVCANTWHSRCVCGEKSPRCPFYGSTVFDRILPFTKGWGEKGKAGDIFLEFTRSGKTLQFFPVLKITGSFSCCGQIDDFPQLLFMRQALGTGVWVSAWNQAVLFLKHLVCRLVGAGRVEALCDAELAWAGHTCPFQAVAALIPYIVFPPIFPLWSRKINSNKYGHSLVFWPLIIAVPFSRWGICFLDICVRLILCPVQLWEVNEWGSQERWAREGSKMERRPCKCCRRGTRIECICHAYLVPHLVGVFQQTVVEKCTCFTSCVRVSLRFPRKQG